jgi:hypothetical protein
LLDYEDALDFELSSQTYGFRLLGAQPISGDIRLLFETEYAKEKDFQSTPNDFDLSYLEVVGGVGYKTYLNVRVGREKLGSDGTFAFQTPLATGHKYQWLGRQIPFDTERRARRLVRHR